jgi:hypothetical protein
MTAALYERIEELTAERDYWKAEAGAIVAADTVARLRVGFGLTTNEARFVAALYAVGGKPMLRLQIEENLPTVSTKGERENPDNYVHVVACRIRKLLGRGFLISQPKRYQLSAEGLDRCRKILARDPLDVSTTWAEKGGGRCVSLPDTAPPLASSMQEPPCADNNNRA